MGWFYYFQLGRLSPCGWKNSHFCKVVHQLTFPQELLQHSCTCMPWFNREHCCHQEEGGWCFLYYTESLCVHVQLLTIYLTHVELSHREASQAQPRVQSHRHTLFYPYLSSPVWFKISIVIIIISVWTIYPLTEHIFFALPKSASLMFMWPMSHMMLPPLMSRCIISHLCRYSTPSKIWRVNRHMVSSVSGPFFAM